MSDIKSVPLELQGHINKFNFKPKGEKFKFMNIEVLGEELHKRQNFRLETTCHEQIDSSTKAPYTLQVSYEICSRKTIMELNHNKEYKKDVQENEK
ncbi:hypothetical protein CHS0354_003399 [Potamilus streckersoni]|uniref:Uncharacterized protein n=1 Tax=Potamilus streckersoni TaxID=2493646 RepID=A0AAE0W048_9BIVA|nr:hypothetical protein CHS0354_003399 [Potamilus streckersoni]